MDSVFRDDIEVKSLGGLKVAVPDFQLKRQEWALESFEYLSEIRMRIEQLKLQSNDPKLLSLTRSRLKKMKDLCNFHLDQMSDQLSFLSDSRIHHSEYARMMSGKKQSYQLNQYHSHLSKDWAWGEEEIGIGFKLIEECLPTALHAEKVLALGAGACRLPYELHRKLSAKQSYFLDINPLLLSVARKVIEGNELELIDIPLVPLNSDSFIVKSKLKNPHPITDGIHYLIHDVCDWGFKEKVFDLVFTPWFIDISPLDAADLIALINSSLPEGGHWINFGPLIFNKTNMSQFYSYEEILYLIEKSGFEIIEKRYTSIPHLKNPNSGRWQHDQVLCFSARKVSDCDQPAHYGNTELVEWLEDHNTKIDMPQSLTEMQLSLGFTLDLAMTCQKGLTINQLAAVLANRHQMPVEQASYLIASTLKLWSKSLK